MFLAKKGFQIDVFEKRADIRKAKLQARRSINLVVADRGWKALEKAGIRDIIQDITVPVYGRMAHDTSGHESFHQYSTERRAIYSISRADLNKKLIEVADNYSNVTYHFEHRCTGISEDGSSASFVNGEGSGITVAADIIFGADGSNSEVRKSMEEHLNATAPNDEHQFSVDSIDYSYKELIMPPGADGKWNLEKSALHIWPRKQYMLMALANLDGGFTCTLFLPSEGENSFDTLKSEEQLMRFFNGVFADAVPLLPTLKEDFFSNPTSALAIVRCHPWIYKDRVALIGDAAHAIVPFYGEGMNCGFEDCDILNTLIGNESKINWKTVLEQYFKERKPNGDAIANLSMRNFVEMRDSFADPKFIFRKKIEAKLQEAFPDKWLPLYSQVKFTSIPYSEAWDEGLRQDRIMEKILAIEGIEDKWESKSFADSVSNLI